VKTTRRVGAEPSTRSSSKIASFTTRKRASTVPADEIDRVAGTIKATHPDFRYQPIAAPEESGNVSRAEALGSSAVKRATAVALEQLAPHSPSVLISDIAG
jgi:hypothetical protein